MIEIGCNGVPVFCNRDFNKVIEAIKIIFEHDESSVLTIKNIENSSQYLTHSYFEYSEKLRDLYNSKVCSNM